MLKIIYGDDRTIEDLCDLFEKPKQNCIDNLLRVLVHKPEGCDRPDYLLKDASTIQYYRCDLDARISLETSKWIGALESALERDYRLLMQISPALSAVCEREHPDHAKTLLARTLRMFLLCEALLLTPDGCSPNNPYKDEVAKLPEPTRTLIENVREATCALGNDWHFSLALAIMAALGESQCEHFQPFTWEAYSAGRARDELLRLWPQHPEVDKAINLIAVLIRCQSAVGQAARGTGSWVFIERFVCGSDTQPPEWIAFDTAERILALRLMAIIEEARNRFIPSQDTSSPDESLRNAGAFREWKSEEFARNVDEYCSFNSSASEVNPLPVYSYIGAQYILGLGHLYSAEQKDLLDARITALSEAIWKTPGLDPKAPTGFCSKSSAFLEPNDYPTVSLGHEQIGPRLRPLLKQAIEKFPLESSTEDQRRYFHCHFRVQELRIPDNYSAQRDNKTDNTLRILLRDRWVAKCLVFPGVVKAPSEGDGDDDGSAAWLFDWLLRQASDVMGDTLSDEKGHWPKKHKMGSRWVENEKRDLAAYVPFPLVRRISNVVYRLRGDRCFSLPITIDNRAPLWVHIPNDVDRRAEQLQLIIVNFILGTILNQAMAKGLDHVDLDLKGLFSQNRGGAARYPAKSAAANPMQPEDWGSAINDIFSQGGYDKLLGRYMRHYNARRDILRFPGMPARSATVQRAAVDPISVGPAAFEALDNYLQQHSNTPMLMVGVDIGGTLTKIQLFRYTASNGKKIEPIGRTLRMQTADPESQSGSEESLSAGKALNKGTKRFAERLVHQMGPACKKVLSKLKARVESDPNGSSIVVPVVIGLTWPGPIHDGHIAGQSNPLTLLHWPKASKNIQYSISEIFEVDLSFAVQNAWDRELGHDPHLPSTTPFVALLNDGDGEAVGAIVDGMSNQDHVENNQGSDLRLAVVKLGTGLAGGLFRKIGPNFSLQPGLFEWGKLILDVGAPPKDDFPQGVASEYLSKRCLPRLAKLLGNKQKNRCFQVDDPDSGEIGRIVEVGHAIRESGSDAVRKKFDDLIFECGARQAERSQPWQIPVSAELVRRLLETQLEIEPDLLFALQIGLKISDPQALLDQVKKDVTEYGRTRLLKLLKCQTEPVNILHSELEGIQELIDDAAGVAEECIRALGAYVGDFCILLHDQLGVNEVILAGGVLSGLTGDIAIDSARKRVKLYGFELGKPLANGAFPLEPEASASVGEKTSGAGNSGSIDRGTLGAAAFAAAGFIRDQKATGLQRLTARLLPLESATKVTVEGTKVLVDGTASRDKDQEVDFAAYALSHDELVNFMKGSALEWGYYQSQGDIFIRWVVR